MHRLYPALVRRLAFAPALLLLSGTALASGILGFARDSQEVNVTEGADFELTVERRGDTTGQSSVDYSFVALTAEPNEDYAPAGGTILFKDGADRGAVPVDLRADLIPEHTETFQIVLSNPTGGAALSAEIVSLVRIRDNDWADEDTLHFVKRGCYDIPVAADPRAQKFSGPAPIPIVVSNIDREVTAVRVKVSDLSHEGPGDLDLVLEGPGGRYCKLMSDFGAEERGAREAVEHLNLCFAADGRRLAPDGRLMTGTWLPFDHEEGDDVLLDRTEVGSDSNDLRIFNGDEPNGTWKLHVVDDFQGDDGNPPRYTGKILGGWELILTLKPVISLPVISEVRNLNTVTVAFFFTGPANETFVWERSIPQSGGWEFVREVTTLGDNQLQQLNSSKNGFPTAIYRFRLP